MENNLEIILQKFYQRLYDNIEKMGKKVIENSIILTFVDIKSNDRFRLLQDSSITKDKIPSDKLSTLLHQKLIRNTDKLNSYIMTAKGVWEFENKRGILGSNKLIEFLDGKFFDMFNISDKPLTDKQKVIIFTMIVARAFSEKSTVDLKKDKTSLDVWKEITDKAFEKLKLLGLISKLDQKLLYGKPGNEHPVSTLFRHTDELPKKTKGIYTALGNQKYFLDIFKDSMLSKEKLSYLFNQIFDNKIFPKQLNEIYNFCFEIAHSKNIFLFDSKEHIFSKPEFDELIRDTLYYL